MHEILAAAEPVTQTPWWFPYGAALLAAIGPIGSLMFAFARSAERRQLERVQGLRVVLDELRAVGVGTGTIELSALGRGATLRRQAEDELRLAAAAYIASAARRPGTIVNGGIAALYGIGLFVGAVTLTFNGAAADPSAAIAVLILGVAGIAISAYGISSVVRRVRTRRLRLASGLPDPLTRDAFLAELRSEGSPLQRSARATLLYMQQ